MNRRMFFAGLLGLPIAAKAVAKPKNYTRIRMNATVTGWRRELLCGNPSDVSVTWIHKFSPADELAVLRTEAKS